MLMNMSDEFVQVILNSLNCSKQTLKRQVQSAKTEQKKVIAESQLQDVLWVLEVLEGNSND